MADPSEDTRVETVTKIADHFTQGTLSSHEQGMAQEIFRLLLNDAAVRVREAMALNLKECPGLPHDVAVALANDVQSVALPVLEFSEVLTDDDLVEIIKSQGEEKQIAIAGRKLVSENVSQALVETDNESVVTTLVSNDGAMLTEDSLAQVVKSLGSSEAVQAALVTRPLLPITIVERLMSVVAGHLKTELEKQKKVPPDLLTDLVMQTWERATISLSSGYNGEQLENLVRHLHKDKRLDHTVVIRALCLGDIRFFETAIAVLVDLPIQNARLLIHESGLVGLESICQKAKLPKTYYPAIYAAIAICNEAMLDGEEHDLERYKRRVIERILTQYDENDVELDSDDLEYLLSKMGQLPHDEVVIH
ncbi:MAG: DUF2336 domain-containing protein [Rhodospirillales bacterium]|jgi:uncharacterized protein (DUF2336 family)